MTKDKNSIVEAMFKVGAHFGLSKSRRHPSTKPFVFGVKNKIEIFDLEKTHDALEKAIRELSGAQHSARLELARKVEQAATELLAERYPGRKLCANVEFFTALLLEAVGVPRELFTVVFAASRVAGYCAHIAEQRRRGRIVRPASRYIGQRWNGAGPGTLAVSS